jgi:sorbitol-specific phosphotransferase system component IIA
MAMVRRLIFVALAVMIALGASVASAEEPAMALTLDQFAERLNAEMDVYSMRHVEFEPADVTPNGIFRYILWGPTMLIVTVKSEADDAQMEGMMILDQGGSADSVRMLSVACYVAASGASDRERLRLMTLAAYTSEKELAAQVPFASENDVELKYYLDEHGFTGTVAPPDEPDA